MTRIMRIATFNCNSVRSRLDAVLRWLSDYTPDVLCLQETKVTDDLFPTDTFTAAGWHVAFKGENPTTAWPSSPSSPLTRFSSASIANPPTPPPHPRRFGGVHVNTYVLGRDIEHEMYAYKLNWLARLKQYFLRAKHPPPLLGAATERGPPPDRCRSPEAEGSRLLSPRHPRSLRGYSRAGVHRSLPPA